MLFKIQPLEADTTLIKTSLLIDSRLSAESLGMLCFVLGVHHREVSLEVILDWWNLDRPKEKHIGKDKFRRIVNDWRLAGYAVVETGTDEDTGKITGKSVVVYPESLQKPRAEKREPRTEETPKGVTLNKPHKFPSAQIFQEMFAVDLDLDSLRHVEAEIRKDLKLWGRVCADHYASLTQQQKDSLTYKTRALKFCLSDFRREKELAEYRGTKTPMKRQDDTGPDDTPKKKTFADYVESYQYGSEKYENFKKNWLTRAEEKGNAEAISQVEEYEGIQRSLAAIKTRKGGVEG